MLPTLIERLTLSKNVPSAENMFAGFANVDEGLDLPDVSDDPVLDVADVEVTDRCRLGARDIAGSGEFGIQ